MFRGFLLAGGLISLLLNSVSAQGKALTGEECKADSDCEGSLDCIQTGLFEKHCFPITCVMGAAHAMLDFGFDSEAYIQKVMADAGMTSKNDFVVMMSNDTDGSHMAPLLANVVPPMDVFDANFTACMTPDAGLRGARSHETAIPNAVTAYGLQWSAAALFSYFGKSSWWTWSDSPIGRVNFQLVSNCIGFLLGGDVGLDFMIQLFSDYKGVMADENFTVTEDTSTSKYTETGDPGDTQYVPVFIAGPFGVQVGWFQEHGPSKQTITEITFGPSFGAALGGFSQCINNQLTLTALDI